MKKGFAMRALLALPLCFGPAVLFANPPERSVPFPEQAHYCQPAFKIMEDNLDGLISDADAIKAAREKLPECRKSNPLGAHLAAAMINYVDKKDDAAIAELRAALKLAPGDSEAQRRLCIVLPKGNERTSVCQGLKKFADTSVLAKYTLAEEEIYATKYQSAIVMFDDVLKRRPDFGTAWALRGLAKYMVGDEAGALADINQTLIVSPVKSYDAQYAKELLDRYFRPPENHDRKERNRRDDAG
jgi:tetratricopeptide (TPR) repeat protein